MSEQLWFLRSRFLKNTKKHDLICDAINAIFFIFGPKISKGG